MNDEQYMQRALLLASRGQGQVSPNPMVGCVVVHEDTIIGEGWHQVYGGPHAEVNAFAAIADPHKIPDATVYVTLEPCSYHGKTPACTDLLLRHQPKRVVIGAIDPNPRVSGSGVEILREAGIDVHVGVLQDECEKLNCRFETNIREQRPYVILKWAQTTDGFLARSNGDSKWISNAASRLLVHQWRAEEDAILVGSKTVRRDNPSLTVREWPGTNPCRVILDRRASIDGSYSVLDGAVRTLVYTTAEGRSVDEVEYIRLDESNYLEEVLRDLYAKNIGSVFVEGGAKVLESFIDSGLWDEARIFTSPEVFGEGIKAPAIRGSKVEELFIEKDRLEFYKK